MSPRLNYPSEWDAMSAEFVYYVMALLVFSIRYPSVFWYTKISFSLVFSAQLLIATVFYVFAYCSFTLVYKFRLNVVAGGDMDLVLPVGVIVLLYLLSNTVVYFSSIAIFHYGFQHYREAYIKYMTSKRRLPRRFKAPPIGCQGYVPHTTATVALVLFITFRAPIVYDCVSLYRRTGNTISLASIIWDVCYMFLWITMWFFFTIKQTWHFKVHLQLPSIEQSPRNAVPEIRTNNNLMAVTNNSPSNTNTTHDVHEHVIENNNKDNTSQIPIQTISQTVENTNSASQSLDDSDATVPNRTSALRKSKERKNGNVHVTFEDSQEEIVNPLAANANGNLEKVSPKRGRRRKKDPSPDVTGGDPKRDKSKSGLGGFPLDTTPENTLTRNYRHSIRDKCGQYYRNSREFSASAPAAQSSPVLPPRQREATTNKPDVLVFNPNTRKPKILRPTPEVRQLSPIRCEDEFQPNVRQLSPIRHPSPVRNPSPNRQYDFGNHSPSRSGAQVPIRNSHPVLTTSSSSVLPHQQLRQNHRTSSPLRLKDASIPNLTERPRSGLANPTFTSEDAQGALAVGGSRNNQSSDALPPRPPRDLRIVSGKTSKPEIGRRDSALPSSNETSSNDSGENVLCSQV